MTAQSTAAPDRLPACHQHPAAPPRTETAPALHPRDWTAALDLVDDGFAALCFDADPASPTRTRRFLRDTLIDWHLTHILEETTAVAAELVSNAIQHALDAPSTEAAGHDSTPATAWIALIHRQHSLICAVADPSPALPMPRNPDEMAETGRGLCIVAALSETWGYSQPEPAGKTVWARIPTKPTADTAD